MDRQQLLTHVRVTAEAILDRLGSDAGRNVEVAEVDFYPPENAPDTDELLTPHGSHSHIQVTLRDGGPEGDIGYALYPLGISEPQAIVTLASQVQDHVTEIVWGQPVPACPDHSHPMTAEVVDRVPVWRCPHDADHYFERIVAAHPKS